MEESFNKSCVESSVFSMAAGSARSEESGWTTYFEDFMASQEQKQEPGVFSCSSAVSGSSSMISDAASCAVAWKPPSAAIAVQPEERRKQLQLRRRRNNRKWLLDDDDDSLQDTACSPVNSPKVTELSCLTMDPNKKDGHWDTAQEGDVGYRNTEQDGGFGFVERSTNECAELKNRGLCLVPLSMLVEYLE